jgi:hypothetical protein
MNIRESILWIGILTMPIHRIDSLIFILKSPLIAILSIDGFVILEQRPEAMVVIEISEVAHNPSTALSYFRCEPGPLYFDAIGS